jgi:hypothetical protein
MSTPTYTAARERRTKAQIEQLRLQIHAALLIDHPQSVRHVFYQMTDPRLPELVEKSDRGYKTVQAQLKWLRRQGIVPYGWITDSTRRGYFTETWSTPAEAVRQVASLYRRSYWQTAPCYVECWCESRSIAGVIQADCQQYAVPLYPAGGFTSITLAFEAAENIAAEANERPVHVLYLGDYDPSGVLIDRSIEAELRRHLSGVEITFHRLAITAEQVVLMGLPTKPPKTGDKRGGFTGGTVEAEAMPAATMRKLLCDAIESFMDRRELRVLEVAEASERARLHAFADMLGARP